MSTAQRVSRGFHRLGVLVAAIPLLVGLICSLGRPCAAANEALKRHPDFNGWLSFLHEAAPIIGVAVIISLAIYGFVRELGR